jgi:hypothetical protein
MAQAFDNFLKQSGFDKGTDGILVFTDPGIHVNTMRPGVRIILMDAIERFGTGFLQAEQVMNIDDVRAIINTIETALQPEDEPEESAKVVPHQQVADSVDSGFLKAMEPLQQRMRFSRRQWILLGTFLIIDALVLIGFLIFILITA